MDLPKFSKAMYVYLITYTQKLFNPFFYDLWRSYQDQLELQLLYFRIRDTFFLLLIILQKRFFFENCMHVQGFFLHCGKSYSIRPPDQYLLVPNILQSFRDISEREQAEPI